MSQELKCLIAYKVEQAVMAMKNVNAVTLVAKGMAIMNQYPMLNESEKKALLFQVLKIIAAGADGVAGTADDVIDAKTMRQLQFMLENNIVQDMVSVFEDVSKGKFNLGKVKSIVGKFIKCFAKPKAT